MKLTITLSILVALFSNFAMAESSHKVTANGETETDCPWSKQDDRSSSNAKEAALKVAAKKQKKSKASQI